MPMPATWLAFFVFILIVGGFSFFIWVYTWTKANRRNIPGFPVRSKDPGDIHRPD